MGAERGVGEVGGVVSVIEQHEVGAEVGGDASGGAAPGGVAVEHDDDPGGVSDEFRLVG